MRIVWNTIRLLAALALCAAASLVFLPAPTIPLFKLSLVVTEYGQWLFLIPLTLALLPARHRPVNLFATALAVIATVLFLSPAIRANAFARRLPLELARAFPAASAVNGPSTSNVPFSWKKLWFAPRVPWVAYDRYIYATHENQDLQLFYYRKGDSPAAPCVIVIHGGGWEDGSARQFPELNQYLAGNGYAVADIEYRLAPRWIWPAQREDVLDAMEYLARHAAELRLDPQRFVLLGRSAGGQIAEAVAYGAHRPDIRGCIAFYAPADMHYAYEFGRADDILNSLRLLRQYLGGTPVEARSNYDSASGLLLANHESPPTLLLHGRCDEIAWFQQSQRLSDRLDTLGTPHFFVRLPWATHAFDYNFNGPGGQISTYAVDAFLAAVTR